MKHLGILLAKIEDEIFASQCPECAECTDCDCVDCTDPDDQ